MASSLVNWEKKMKRTESKKSHSWWWDSHISPKNSKWLAENLEEMDLRVKRMLKLIEEDGDSLAKKADMYYQKRPELISHVEEFYRMYRSLAERYDNVTGELRKNIPSDLQSQGSGVSDISSEPVSTCPSPERKQGHRKSSHRAAGFDVFLGSGGSSSDVYTKEEDESSSLLDSESESDESSVNNYPGQLGNNGDQEQRMKIIELEAELRDMREKLQLLQAENADGSLAGAKNENSSENLLVRIANYDEELKVAKEKIRVSEEEVSRLKIELQKYGSSEFSDKLLAGETLQKDEAKQELEEEQVLGFQERSDPDVTDHKIQMLMEELRVTKERLQDSEKDIAKLQGLVDLAEKGIATWRHKLDAEKREVSKLQERVARYKTSLLDRNNEIRELKEALSDADQGFSVEKIQLHAKISTLSEERNRLEERLKEWELRCRYLEEEVRRAETGKSQIENMHGATERRLSAEIECLKADIVERNGQVEDLHKSLDALKLKYDTLVSERNDLNAKVLCRNDRIYQMEKHLNILQSERDELCLRVGKLEEVIEKQRVAILERAEEKREAIRQLCFSLEHYRNRYHRLRKAFMGHKRLPITAS
ncbi:protein NETWORKED 4A [Malania oleifera]|uniref:protein NETWORKED 4A n=1 Tax=Malania oleifera TaxID=397392 RepID=UPI0025AECAA6|nr:protein NETWORKED 4A [Malania oleifera]